MHMTIQQLAEALENLGRQWSMGLLTDSEYVINVQRFLLIFNAKNA